MSDNLTETLRTVSVGLGPLSIEDIVALSRGEAQAKVDDSSGFRTRMETDARRFADLLASGERVYGVTTGFGESCVNTVGQEQYRELAFNLVEFHGCGTGPNLSEEEAAGVIATCLATLSAGWSAVRPVVLDRLCDLLNHRLIPVIPSQGSVGASGDLTPLSYVAAVLLGLRDVTCHGRITSASSALREAGLTPIELGPKESLAIMNGTGVMTALNCLSYNRARRLARLAAALTAMASDVLRGNRSHFDDRIFAAKPHKGQRTCARWIRGDVEYDPAQEHSGRIQDRYSIRCAPHVIGVLLDGLSWMREWTEIELNGANYNPLVDPETGDILHGGNFYGGHSCFVADSMKNAVANVADLLDRQMSLLCSSESNNGLTENLVGRGGDGAAAHHGFKAMQIAASALAAESLKLTMPASVFSRSTECHNQDKVSMGTIAARDCVRVLDMTETLAAIYTLALCQAVDLRQAENCHGRALAIRDAVRLYVPFNDRDRRQDFDIEHVLKLIRNDELRMGEIDID